MRKLLLFVCLIMAFASPAQTVTVAIGTDGYVTINGQNYKRGDLRSVYTYRTTDSFLAIIYSSDRQPLIKATKNTSYLYADSTNKVARNMLTLRTWFNTNFEYKP